jgi:putative sugar O-methyltransferase
MDKTLASMFDCIEKGRPIYLPSLFWRNLNKKNIDQLESEGIDNIKQTVAQNYFTWVVGRDDPQFKYLEGQMTLSEKLSIWLAYLVHDWNKSSYTGGSSRLTRAQYLELAKFTRMIWKLAERLDNEEVLKNIAEPEVGNPFGIFMSGKLVTQDIANSVIEYYSIREHFTSKKSDSVTICELGAGYGRNAYVFLKAFPRCKYVVIDIPPALYVSQHYLSRVFPDKKIFDFRCFDDYKDVEKEYQDADIVFLLPHQAEMLPDKSVDLFVNISSLHEMTFEQIKAYIGLIGRLTKGYFYSKQWLVSHNNDDGIVVNEKDYPIPGDWKSLYQRVAKVQVHFFESMYYLGTK